MSFWSGFLQELTRILSWILDLILILSFILYYNSNWNGTLFCVQTWAILCVEMHSICYGSRSLNMMISSRVARILFNPGVTFSHSSLIPLIQLCNIESTWDLNGEGLQYNRALLLYIFMHLNTSYIVLWRVRVWATLYLDNGICAIFAIVKSEDGSRVFNQFSGFIGYSRNYLFGRQCI